MYVHVAECRLWIPYFFKKFGPSNHSAPFTKWLKIVSNNSAKVVTRICYKCMYGNRMRAQMEYWTLTSKNLVKLKRDYYFHAEIFRRSTAIWNMPLHVLYIPALNDFSDGSLQLFDSVLYSVEVFIDLVGLRIDLCLRDVLTGQRLEEASSHRQPLQTTDFITKGLTLSLGLLYVQSKLDK